MLGFTSAWLQAACRQKEKLAAPAQLAHRGGGGSGVGVGVARDRQRSGVKRSCSEEPENAQVAGIAARLANLESPSPPSTTTKRARMHSSGLTLAVGPAFGAALGGAAADDRHNHTAGSIGSPSTTHGGWRTGGADTQAPLASPALPSPLGAQGGGGWPSAAAAAAAPRPPCVPPPWSPR